MNDLQQHVDYIANRISKAEVTADQFFEEHVHAIELIRSGDELTSALLQVAGGGPSMWVNTRLRHVVGQDWDTLAIALYADKIGLDDYINDLYGQ